MLKDIEFPEIKGVSVAVVYSVVEGNDQWVVHILNESKFSLENVMVVSKGYGTVNGEKVKTSTLRRSFEVIPTQETQQIEPIIEEVFGLNNEYWLSFFVGKKMYDKKFVFTAGSLSKKFLVNIPILNTQGILHP